MIISCVRKGVTMNRAKEKYYQLILEKENSASFVNIFENQWSEFLRNYAQPYSEGQQLYIGNRLRPILCCWGYMHCFPAEKMPSFKDIAQVAVSVEAIHKASVMIDDVIDGDTKRRGIDCFHVQFSKDETIFFAVCLLAGAIKNVNLSMQNIITNQSILTSAISTLCDVISDMCMGAINEINTSTKDRYNLGRIQEIINSETVSLLTNSFLLGYWATNQYDDALNKVFSQIGSRSAYIFQVMNDLEPFCNPEYIMKHKGNLNADCLRSRKNIVIPYLYSIVSHKEKIEIDRLLNSEKNYVQLKILFDKHHILDLIMQDIRAVKSCIYSDINSLPLQKVSCEWKEAFPYFVADLIAYCESVVYGLPFKWNS